MVDTEMLEALVTEGDLVLIRQLCLPYKTSSLNMGLDVGALKMRVGRLCVKLGVENRTSIVVKALKLGLITIDELVYQEYDVGKNLLREDN